MRDLIHARPNPQAQARPLYAQCICTITQSYLPEGVASHRSPFIRESYCWTA